MSAMNSSAARVVAGVPPTLPVGTRSQSRLQLGTLLAMPSNSKRFRSFRVCKQIWRLTNLSAVLVYFPEIIEYVVSENKDRGYILAMLGPFVSVNIILNVKNDRCIFQNLFSRFYK